MNSLESSDRRSGTERRAAVSQQHPPVGNGSIVLDAVLAQIDRFPNHFGGTLALREDLIARALMGEKKYGTKLRVFNGRSAIVDLYQELQDALMYSMQGRIEGDKTAGNLVELLLRLASDVAAELDAR